MAKDKAGKTTKMVVDSLGDYLKEQRLSAQLSLRQLADQVGVSNPYLSQIERGLRKPSAEVLQQLARALRVSAEQLYVRAGILDERTESDLAVESALLADSAITERQKRMLLEIYRSFRAENTHAAEITIDRANHNTASDGPRRRRSSRRRPLAADRRFMFIQPTAVTPT